MPVLPARTGAAPVVTPVTPPADEAAALAALEARLGHLHVRQRLGIEQEDEGRLVRRATHAVHVENWRHAPALIRACLRLAGLYGRGRRNALAIELRRHEALLPRLPAAFDGFTILHLSDLHVDISAAFVDALIGRVRSLDYDLCVLTGDYRARTSGPIAATLAGLERLRPHLRPPVYAVLGNHDSLRMVPPMEAMGYRVLMNEWARLARGGDVLYLAGIDDAHYYRTENFHRAAHDIPPGAASILLSHTPETWRRAAHAGFDLMLCGHTHGGQICLPGGIPLLTEAASPRRLARGPWRHGAMLGYTSAGAGSCIVDVRLNCPPEVTLHRLGRPPQ